MANINRHLFDAFEDDIEVLELLQFGLPRRVYRRSQHFNFLDDLSFFRRFRITKNTVLEILNLIEHEIEHPSDMNNSISPINQLLLTLRFYATGNHLLSLGDFSGAHVSTASRIVKRVTTAIARLAPDVIKFPDNAEDIKKKQNDFYNIASFPKVIAAVDGTHIKIQSPGGVDAEIFRNRKNYFSVNTQAMCDANLQFTNIVARWPGSAHDSTIFNNSAIKQRFENGEYPESIILGDSGYNIRPYLMTPIINPITNAEQLYNESQIRSRNIIERIFGIWKRRFPVLAYGCRLKLETTLKVIVATAVIHNFARRNNEPDPPLPEEVEEHVLQQLIQDGQIPAIPQVQNNAAGIGMHVRRNLIDQYFGRL